MNYYIIPTNKLMININITTTTEKIEPFISNSLFLYLNNNKINDDVIENIMSHYEFILNDEYIKFYDIIKQYKFIKHSQFNYYNAIFFFELIELLQFNKDIINLKNDITICHLTSNNNNNTSIYLIKSLRKFNKDTNISVNFNYNILFKLFINNYYKFDLLICEFLDFNLNNYIKNMLLIVLIILKQQNENGVCIIKIGDMFYKPIIQIIFILSSFYDKIYLIKPTISNYTSSDKYLICKRFKTNTNTNTNININTNTNTNLEKDIINYLLFSESNDNIESILENNLPLYFLNKLEEINIIIGHQQIETMDNVLNILKHKKQYEKMEVLKKNNIQKCAQWCEKNLLNY
jgi:hypothetical protein